MFLALNLMDLEGGGGKGVIKTAQFCCSKGVGIKN